MKKRRLYQKCTCGAKSAVHTWEMTNLNDDLNSWMSAVKRFTNCPVLLASKKATSCLKKIKRGVFCFFLFASSTAAPNNMIDHPVSPSHVQLLMDLIIHFLATLRDYTWGERQKGFSSCLPPLSHPPGKARWCSHWSAGPVHRKEIIRWRKTLKYISNLIYKYYSTSLIIMVLQL